MNKIIQLLREGLQSRLIVGNAVTGVVLAGTSVDINVPIEVDQILLKSIEVTANKNVEFRVEFFEESTHTNSRYNSGNVTLENYDVLDLPYRDKESQQVMYFRVHNTDTVDAEYTIEVRGIQLK